MSLMREKNQADQRNDQRVNASGNDGQRQKQAQIREMSTS